MWVCTECSKRHKTEVRAGKCHWGIGGVVTEEDYERMYGNDQN